MSNAWSERAQGDAVHLEFAGLDAEKREAQELTRFRSSLADEPNDPEQERFPGLSFLLISFALTWILLPIVLPKMIVAVALLVIAGFILRCIVVGLRAPRNLPLLKPEIFVLEMSASGLALRANTEEAERFELSQIERFEGDRRLTLVRVDGTRKPLRCVLTRQKDHAQIAERLNEILKAQKAAAGGYR